MPRRLLACLALVALVVLAPGARAADLTIAMASEPSSMDPHFQILTPNEMVAKHVFEPLVEQGPRQEPLPGLAVAWKAIDATTWQFDLRPNVHWHDGAPFTADDVVFTMHRAPKVPNSPASYNLYLKQVTDVYAQGPLTVIFKTAKPFPLHPFYLSNILIVQRKAAEHATTNDFNSGKAMIGTGPYKFVEWVQGDHISFVRNDDYWGAKEPWAKVTIKPISNPGARVAALLSGGVDLIDNVPSPDALRLKADANVAVYAGLSNLVMLLNLDQGSAKTTPFATDKAGRPLTENPFAKLAVRRAISKAINREAIVDHVMEGAAEVASQPVSDLTFGASPNLKPERYDPDDAKKLLAEAGYPDGFGTTIHGPNNRYPNDAQICQAIAQMLARVGIQTKVETMPLNVFFTRASNREFSLFLTGWGAVGTGEASVTLNAVLHTFSPDLGAGAANRGRYSNPTFDKLLETAMTTFDADKRAALLAQANEVAMADVAIIPLHVPIYRWATRKGLVYIPRMDTQTLAMGTRPQ